MGLLGSYSEENTYFCNQIKGRCAKNRYETFAQHIDGFDALVHGGLPERGHYSHALPSF